MILRIDEIEYLRKREKIMLIVLVRYKCKPGLRENYLKAIKDNKIDEMSRSEEGCIRYEYSFGMEEDELILTEIWQDGEAIDYHKNSEHFARLGELKLQYVESTEFEKYSAEQI